MFSSDRAKSHQAEGQEKTGCCGFTMINKKASRKGGQRHKIMIEGEAKRGREVLSLQSTAEQKNNGPSSIHYQNITLKGPRMYRA